MRFLCIQVFSIFSATLSSLSRLLFTERQPSKENSNSYKEEFFSDALSVGYLSFEESNPQPQSNPHKAAGASRQGPQPQFHLPVHRTPKHRQNRNGKGADNVAMNRLEMMYFPLTRPPRSNFMLIDLFLRPKYLWVFCSS